MKPKSQWSGSHTRLKRLYEAKVPPGMTQKDFAKKYGLGSQSMVAQYLNGDRPLNFEATVKFADALDVTVYDISPEMGDWIKEKLMPVLGKALRRAAMVLLSIGLYQLAPSDAFASTVLHNHSDTASFFAKFMNSLHIAALWLKRLACGFLSSCVPTHIFHALRTAR